MNTSMEVGIIGAGAMGSGIAQVAARAGHQVRLLDARPGAAQGAVDALRTTLSALATKGRLTPSDAEETCVRLRAVGSMAELTNAGLVIEAIVEDLSVKRGLFAELESVVRRNCILATNTSSLSVTAIAGACAHPERVIGLHFFNPAPLMPLVEVVPGLVTADGLAEQVRQRMSQWGKTPVICKDTPGFIVNRVARPFYGEALRILEEGLADMVTIDHAMRAVGGFRMGPFELMDLIGNDVNFAVTRSVFEAFFFDPRYRPSLTQQRQVESGRLGRKSGRGYYDHTGTAAPPTPKEDPKLLNDICWRIVVMLINEAADALYLGIADRDALELAMTKGVNYPKGLLRWADEVGLEHCLSTLEHLQAEYGEDRYRPSPLLRKLVREQRNFHG
ncbi:MAG TPA: 3-hydroxyacyl-CoA dehydrogenase NAD-binding domain-containing protein [Flavobacteriales bacterium]|nr:3-hydroxyacyl-CoA dehydrogenase NAD-binding domain-containing protein [Flavobacteriales bacterium]HMR25875.1 3-hydroxyacyl-CoA dehydrogenase NAD-binding domain-containing protein [Flavobacteriales bacterium]